MPSPAELASAALAHIGLDYQLVASDLARGAASDLADLVEYHHSVRSETMTSMLRLTMMSVTPRPPISAPIR